jgi:hypothetical protein
MDSTGPIVHVVGSSRADAPPLDATMDALNSLTIGMWLSVTTNPLLPERRPGVEPRRSSTTLRKFGWLILSKP